MITLHLSDALIALVAVLLLALHYIVRRRRITDRQMLVRQIEELREQVSQLESLNASMAQRLITFADILAAFTPARADELHELTRSLLELFRKYQAGGVRVEAAGDVNVSGDVVGQDKK